MAFHVPVRVRGDTRRKPSRAVLDRGDPINRGLRSAFAFDEGGGTPHDLTRRHTATLSGSPNPGWVTGTRGNVLDFSGTALVTESFETLELPFTVAVWFRTSTLGSIQTLWMMADSSAGNSYHWLEINSTDEVLAQSRDSTTSNSATAPGVITVDTWHLAVGVWSAVDVRAVYLDASHAGTGSLSVSPTSLDVYGWGRAVDSTPGYNLTGQLMLGRTWNRALSAAEIRRLYVEPWAGVVPSLRTPIKQLDERPYRLLVSADNRGDARRKPSRAVLDRGDPINRGLVSVIPFTEGSGSPHDLAQGNIGIPDNGFAWGHSTLGMGMLGTDFGASHVQFPDDANNVGTDPYTLLVYCIPGKLADGQTICLIGQTGGGTMRLSLDIQTDNTVDFVTDDNVDFRRASSTSTIAVGEPLILVATSDGGGGTMRLYFNGAEEGTATQGSQTLNAAPDPSLKIGSLISGSGFTGNILLYRQWNRALTAAEARRLYVEPWAGVVPSLRTPIEQLDEREYNLLTPQRRIG